MNLFTKVKELRIHYKIYGCGQPLVLLHGWGNTIGNWEKLQAYLAQRFQVIAVDLPGFGLSAVPETLWDTATYAEFLRDFLVAINITKPIILGHSFGGKIATYALAKRLFDAEQLILVASSGINLPKSWKIRGKIFCYKLLKKLAAVPVLKYFFTKIIAAYQNQVGSNDYRNSSGIMRKIMVKVVNQDLRDLLPRVVVPTALIWGQEDQSTPVAAGKLMQQLIPNSQIIILENCGHFPLLDDFQGFIAILDKVLIEKK
ncbi:MAG: alpha/beta hydrolase [Gammaproteobacteria bacterium]|nr:alpha/beta hydrolase [Gammaproteobacteria bacterium]